MRSVPHWPLVALVAGLALGLASPGVDIIHSRERAGLVSPGPVRIELGKHRFGETRESEATVVRVKPGDGPAEIGFDCPVEGECAMPTSIDIGADGSLWVTDPVNHRLLAWEPRHPASPSRAIPVPFAPADLALAPDGTIYVTGSEPGVLRGMRLFALDAAGRQRWMSALATEEEFSFNSHIRMGPGDVLYSIDHAYGWAPAIDLEGRPLDPAEQLRLAHPAQPLEGGRNLAVTGTVDPGHLAPTAWTVVLSGPSGAAEQTWQIVAEDDLGLSLEAVPTVVGGDPVLAFEVYRFEEHLMEHVVLRLSPTGLRDGFSLDRGGHRGGTTITDIRVGPDGKVYQLHTNPETGMSVGRYALASGSTPGPSPSSAPSAPLRSADSAAPTPSPSVATSRTPTAAASSIEAAVTAPSVPPAPPSESSPPAATTIAVVLGTLAVIIALTTWFVRRTRSPASSRQH